MLTNSDNDIAEALARQTALASDEPASFEGGATAIRTQLKKLGLPVKGAKFADGSGLDRADKLTADLLTALLAKAADPAHPELRAALTGLPVAGFTGTLRTRYADQRRHRPRTRQDRHPDRREHPGGHGGRRGRPPPGLRLPDVVQPTHRPDSTQTGPGPPGVNLGDLRLQLSVRGRARPARPVRGRRQGRGELRAQPHTTGVLKPTELPRLHSLPQAAALTYG